MCVWESGCHCREKSRLQGREEDDGWSGSCLQTSAAGMTPYKYTTLTYQSRCQQITLSDTHTVHTPTKCVKETEESGWKRVGGEGQKMERCQRREETNVWQDCKIIQLLRGLACWWVCLCAHPHSSLPYYFCPVAMATIILMPVCMCLGNVKSTLRFAEIALSTPESGALRLSSELHGESSNDSQKHSSSIIPSSIPHTTRPRQP